MNPIRICSAFWTASSAVATDTTDLAPAVQNMVDTVGKEVKQTSGILNKIFQPMLDKFWGFTRPSGTEKPSGRSVSSWNA